MRSRPQQLGPVFAFSLGLLGLSACDDYPRDPNGTLEQVLATRTLRAVAVHHEPWVIAAEGQTPSGAEVELVEAFAQDLDVEIEWHRALAFEALAALERGDADLAVGGFTATAVDTHPSGAHTYTYFIEKLVVAADPGTPIPQDIEGERILMPRGLLAESLIENENGIPVAEPGEGIRLVLLPHWQIPESGLLLTQIELRTDEHVLAVPAGENAWLMRLERFLRDEAGDVGARLRKHAS